MQPPLISVLILTFRRPQLLKRAVDSVLSQTYPHFKICIYDDASKDQTPQIIEAYRDERIYYYQHVENVGLNNNYNFALGQVQTPFFVFLSDDDFFLPHFLEEAVKAFISYPEAGVFIGGMVYIDSKNRIQGMETNEWSCKSYYSPEEIIYEMVQGRFSALINAMLFRTQVRDHLERFNDKIWLDIDFVTRCLLRTPAVVSQEACIVYQLHSHNVSNAVHIEEYLAMKKSVRDCIVQAKLDLPLGQEALICALDNETRKFFYRIAYDRFVNLRFNDSLHALKILEELRSLNGKEKIIKRLSNIFLKIKILSHLFAQTVSCWRFVRRFLRSYELKKEAEKIGLAKGRAYSGF